MKTVKVAMSLLAAFLLACAGAALAGQVTISPDGVSFLQALASALLVFGFTPMVVSPQVGRGLAAVSLVVSLALGGQWAFLAHLELLHPVFVRVLHAVGFVNAVVAFIAHSSAAAPGSSPPAIPPPSRPAAA